MIGSVDDFHRRVASIHTMYLIIIWGQGECNQPHWRSSGVSSLVSSQQTYPFLAGRFSLTFFSFAKANAQITLHRQMMISETPPKPHTIYKTAP